MRFEVAVVDDIVLDENSVYFTNAGEWNGIGTVAFSKVLGSNRNAKGFAKPYFANISTYPLRNELVYIFQLPTPNIQTNNLEQGYYYLCSINAWGSPQHNGIPNIFQNDDLPDSQKRDYQQVTEGSTREVVDTPSEINLGHSFTERSYIKPLRRFEGDLILEGRLGNSIRLGTTNIAGTQPLNAWSRVGDSGDPILILRNGQGATGSVGFLPTVEDVNTDPSSIYLTTTQQLPFTPASINSYMSYGQKPIASNVYVGSQILITSDRVFINSKKDHILLSSAKSINLNAQESVNIDTTGDTVVQSGKVLLGSKSAEEPLLLGETTKQQLQELKSILHDLLVAATAAANGGGPVASLVAESPKLLSRLQLLDLDNITSKRVFTV